MAESAQTFDPLGDVIGGVEAVTRGAGQDMAEDEHTKMRVEGGDPRAFEPLGEAAGTVEASTRGTYMGDHENERSYKVNRRSDTGEAFAPLTPLPAVYSRIGSLPLSQQ